MKTRKVSDAIIIKINHATSQFFYIKMSLKENKSETMCFVKCFQGTSRFVPLSRDKITPQKPGKGCSKTGKGNSKTERVCSKTG